MSHDEDQVREVMVAVDAAHGAAVRRGVLCDGCLHAPALYMYGGMVAGCMAACMRGATCTAYSSVQQVRDQPRATTS